MVAWVTPQHYVNVSGFAQQDRLALFLKRQLRLRKEKTGRLKEAPP